MVKNTETDYLIVVNKDFTNLRYGFLRSVEILLFYRLLLAGKNLEEDNNLIKEDFSIIQKELNIKAKDLKNEIFEIQDRFLKAKIKYSDNKGIGTITLFENIYNNIEEATIEATLTKRGKKFLQDLSDGYIRFLFTDILKFKSKYSKLLLPHLMNVSHLKKLIISKEKLLQIFEIEEKDGYNNLSNFNRVVLKAVETDLKDIFEDFKITKNKEGRIIKEYIFTWSNNFNFKKDFSKEEKIIDNTDEIIEKFTEELADEEKIKKFISENIPTLNYKSIEKNIKSRLENGENPEEIIAFIKRNWHRAIDSDKYQSKVGILKKALEENFELNLTKGEIEKEKNILNGKGIIKKEVKHIKSNWDTPKSSKVEEKEEVKKEEVKEKKKEIISYKEYLERKEIELKKLTESSEITDKKLDILIRKMNFFLSLRGKVQVNLTKIEYEQETENLKKYFQSEDEIIKKEVKNIFVITEEKEVAVAEVEAEAEEKANFKIISIQEIEEEEKKHKEYLQWLDDVNNLPSSVELSEIYYNIYALNRDRNDFIDKFGKENKETIAEFDKEIANLEKKRKELELKQEEEKKELLNKKYSNNAKEKISNIKSIKDFTAKEVTEVKKEEADPFDEEDIASIFKK